MTYSIQVRAATRDECKRRVTAALHVQTTPQAMHVHDRVHVERLLHALVDLQNESPFEEIVVDAYGYLSVAGDGTVRLAVINAKVYTAARQLPGDGPAAPY